MKCTSEKTKRSAPTRETRLLGALSEELLIERPARERVQAVEWEPLLRQIATSYSLLGSNQTAAWVAPGGAEQFLRDLSTSKLKGWAVTGSFAASQRVSVTAPDIAVVLTEDPERLAEAMRLRPVRNGENVVTALPYDRLVFERTCKEDNLVYASVAQIVMDCMTGFGRMPAEAFLFEVVEILVVQVIGERHHPLVALSPSSRLVATEQQDRLPSRVDSLLVMSQGSCRGDGRGLELPIGTICSARR